MYVVWLADNYSHPRSKICLDTNVEQRREKGTTKNREIHYLATEPLQTPVHCLSVLMHDIISVLGSQCVHSTVRKLYFSKICSTIGRSCSTPI